MKIKKEKKLPKAEFLMGFDVKSLLGAKFQKVSSFRWLSRRPFHTRQKNFESVTAPNSVLQHLKELF